jgi:predicted CoA-binding protein
MAQTVAIVGASRDRSKFGNKAVRAYLAQGYTVYPVNPHEQEVEGLSTYPSILDVPGPVDRASFYVPPEIGIALLSDVAKKGVRELFLNPGSESPELMARADELGLNWTLACSIVAIGESPATYR